MRDPEPYAVGFTGTELGMTDDQKRRLRVHLEVLSGDAFKPMLVTLHHGDCVGADAEADAIAREMGCKIVVHPPDDPKLRAWCAQPGDVVWTPKPYLKRDDDIARVTAVLIAAPAEETEQVRSGTWATVRYARKHGTGVLLITPRVGRMQ